MDLVEVVRKQEVETGIGKFASRSIRHVSALAGAGRAAPIAC